MTKKFRQNLQLIIYDLRLFQVWNYKIPLILSYAFISITLNHTTFLKSIYMLFFYTLFLLGSAAFAYLINDYFDIEQDLKQNKNNIFQKLRKENFPAYMVITLVVSAAPWFFLPADSLTVALIILLFGLFTAYCLPPIRLKNRRFYGIITDALYAHAIWVILTFHTFLYYSGNTPEIGKLEFLPLFLWQLILGIRNITLHQIADYDHDLAAGAETWVVKTGLDQTTAGLKLIILPTEILFLVISAMTLSRYFSWILPTVMIFWLYSLFRRTVIYTESSPVTIRQFAYSFLDDYYYQWLPVVILLNLIMHGPVFILFLFVYLILFKNGFYSVYLDMLRLFSK